MKCLRMLTFLPLEQIDEMDHWQDAKINEAKEILAYELTSMVHGKEEAEKAQNAAKALFSTGGDLAHMPTTTLTGEDLADGAIGILDLMVKCGLAPSKKEARRLVEQGGVEVNGEKAGDPTTRYEAASFAGEGMMLKKGKKVFHRVVTE
jgi:tyrosyl-tRNA synthetase